MLIKIIWLYVYSHVSILFVYIVFEIIMLAHHVNKTHDEMVL